MNELRERLICEAEKLFYIYGFKKSSMEKIALRSKISKKTMYKIFNSKDEFIKTFLEWKLKSVTEDEVTIFDKTSPIEDISREYIELLRKLSFSFSSQMLNDLKHMPEMFSIVEKKRKTMFIKYKILLNEAKNDGKINPDLNTDVFMEVLTRTIDSIIDVGKIFEFNISSGEFVEQIMTIFFFGISKNHK